MIARTVAAFVLLAALLCAAAEGLQWLHSGAYDTFTGAELWYALDRVSLALLQAGVQRYVAPWVWDPVLLWFLTRPAWLLLGLPALMVLWLKQPKLHPRFLRKRYFAPARKAHRKAAS